MKIKQALMLSAAAVWRAALFAGVPSQPARADAGGRDRQRRHRRRRHRPEGSGGRRLGDRRDHRPARPNTPRSSSPTTRAATCCPTCRRRNTRCGCAAMAWSIPPRSMPSPAGSSISPRWSRRTRRRRRNTTRRSTGTRCCAFRRRANSPAPVRQGNGINPGQRNQHHWLADVKSLGCISCHALGTPGTRTIPREFSSDFANSRDAWMRRIQAGQAMGQMVGVTTRLGPDRAVAEWANWTDRVAAGETPKAKPTRPQGVERNVVLTLWDWGDPEDLSARPDRHRPAQADGQCQRQDLRLAGALIGPGAGARSGDAHRVDDQASGARSEDAVDPRAQCDDAVALLGRRADLDRAGRQPQPDDG